MSAASVKAAATVETSIPVEASAKARLPTGGKASCHSSMIETAKCSGMSACLGV
jgi:hypothetical protein